MWSRSLSVIDEDAPTRTSVGCAASWATIQRPRATCTRCGGWVFASACPRTRSRKPAREFPAGARLRAPAGPDCVRRATCGVAPPTDKTRRSASEARGQADVVAATAAPLLAPPPDTANSRPSLHTTSDSARGRVLIVDGSGRRSPTARGPARRARTTPLARRSLRRCMAGAHAADSAHSATLKETSWRRPRRCCSADKSWGPCGSPRAWRWLHRAVLTFDRGPCVDRRGRTLDWDGRGLADRAPARAAVETPRGDCRARSPTAQRDPRVRVEETRERSLARSFNAMTDRLSRRAPGPAGVRGRRVAPAPDPAHRAQASARGDAGRWTTIEPIGGDLDAAPTQLGTGSPTGRRAAAAFLGGRPRRAAGRGRPRRDRARAAANVDRDRGARHRAPPARTAPNGRVKTARV